MLSTGAVEIMFDSGGGSEVIRINGGHWLWEVASSTVAESCLFGSKDWFARWGAKTPHDHTSQLICTETGLLYKKHCFKSNYSDRHLETLDRQIIRNAVKLFLNLI